MSKTIEQLFKVPPAADTEEAAAQREVDEEVFRGQHIPKTLFELDDIEGYHDMVNGNLVAGKVGDPGEGGGESEDEDESGSGAPLDSDGSGEEEKKASGGYRRPRGHEKNDEQKKQEIKVRHRLSAQCGAIRLTDVCNFQDHKKEVKEAQREKRKEKMPKHLKKRLVAATARRKK